MKLLMVWSLLLVLTACAVPVQSIEMEPMSQEVFVRAFAQAAVATSSAPPGSEANTTHIATPSPTSAPLTENAIASCPVSLPNLEESPDPYYISTSNGYGNPERTIFIGLHPDGKVIFQPGGPGSISADGSLGMKFWFYRTIPGDVVFSGHRLDAPAPPMPTIILRGEEDGYGETGFHPAGLIFPTEGCWKVTAQIGDASMTFVTLVVKVSPLSERLPETLANRLVQREVDESNLPQSIRYVYSDPDRSKGNLVIEISQDMHKETIPYPDAATQRIRINGEPALCINGAWEDEQQQQWDAEADVERLEWRFGDFHYRVSHTGLGLGCSALVQMTVRLAR